jgi:outer membrane lipoprotein SlyB
MQMIRQLGRVGAILALTMALGTACQPDGNLTPALVNASMTAEQMPRISATDLKTRLDSGESIVIVDVRAPSSFLAERVKGAVNAPYSIEGQDFSQLPKDRFVALYCT